MPDALNPAPESPAESSTSISSDDFMSFADDPENLISASAETSQQTQSDDTDSLSSEASQETPAGEEATGDGVTQPPPAVSFKGVTPEVVAVMKHLSATNKDYDLTNPTIFKLVRQAAEKELLVRKTTPSTPEAQDYLDAFNDPEPSATAAETPRPGAAASEDLPSFVKVAREWKEPADFTKSLYRAFDMEEGPEKERAVSEVMLGFVDRSFHELYLPKIQRMVEQIQQSQLGPVLTEVQASRDEQERSKIVQQMKTIPGTEDIMDLFEAASDAFIDVGGEKVPDTWINRVIVENPYILKLRVDGRTPAETKRKTLAEQYRVAHHLMKAQREKTTDPAAAQRLINAGQSLERSRRDPVRTGLNAGRTGVTAGNRGGDDLFSGGSSSVDFNNLF